MKVNFSKLDVAKRQLETAIDLFFRNGDPVSIHTLACAAQEILEAALGSQGVKSVHKELIDSIRPEKQRMVQDKINEPKNFFKHGKRDIDKIIAFEPELSTYFIWDACQLYEKLTKERVRPFFIFNIWFATKNKEAFVKWDEALGEDRELFNTDNRAQFYQDCSNAYDKL